MPFPICFLMRYLRPIVPKFYHVLALSGHLAYSSTSLPRLLIIFPNFFISNVVKTTTSFNCRCHWYVCICCTCDNERTWTHDTICNTFFTIMQNADFHVGWKQLHAFPSTTFNSSYQQIDNVFTKDGIHTLTHYYILCLFAKGQTKNLKGLRSKKNLPYLWCDTHHNLWCTTHC